MTAFRITSRVSVGDVLASTVSVALPLLGVALVASQEWQEAIRTAGMPGSAIERKAHGNRRPDHTTARVMLHPVSQHQTLMARSSVEQATLVAPLSRRRVLQGDGVVHADRVCDWRLSQ